MFPLTVIGMNSIAIYVMVELGWGSFICGMFRRYFGRTIFQVLGTPYESLLGGLAVMLTFWLVLYWMYRRKIFLRI